MRDISARILLIIIIVCGVQLATAQSMGKIIEERTVKSTILNKSVRYTVYLPADCEHSERTYPVVYLLHGFTDDNTGWLQFGEINRYADKAIADGIIPPMIIVMPNGDSSFILIPMTGKRSMKTSLSKNLCQASKRHIGSKQKKDIEASPGCRWVATGHSSIR